MKGGKSKIVKYESGNQILKSTDGIGALILGDCNSAMDKKIQKQHNIKTVISIGQEAMPIKQKLPENSKHFFFDVHDNKSQKVSTEMFDQINNLIEQGRKNGGVLVHCYAGVSRSSTFVIAYIMSKFLKSYNDAKQQVKNARSCIYPNDGFVHHLKNYQKVIEMREKQRLRKLQQEKNRLMEQSLVQSARKSMRGGVKGAAISPQKVKQINQQRQKKQFEIFVQPLVINQQKKTQNQPNKSLETTKIKNNMHHIKTLSKFTNQKRQKEKKSKSIFLTKSFSITQKPKQQIKLPKVKQSSQTSRTFVEEKGIERLVDGKVKNRYKYDRNVSEKKQKQVINKQSQSIPLLNKKQKYSKPLIEDSQKYKQKSIKTQSIMRDSKSVSNYKAQKTKLSEIDQSLLNDHEKKIKKIYDTKIIVK